jgi:hypothetical protein
VHEYRHTAVSIGREVVGEHFAAGYRTEIARGDGGGGAAEEGEGSSKEDGEDPLERQTGRATAIGTVAHAVRADLVQGLSTRSIDVFRTLSYTWHAFLGFAQAEKEPPALLKRKQKQSSSQAAQAQHNGTEENSPAPKRAQIAREGQAALASPMYEGEGRDRSNVDGEEEEKGLVELSSNLCSCWHAIKPTMSPGFT